jgi:hypothetical protein
MKTWNSFPEDPSTVGQCQHILCISPEVGLDLSSFATLQVTGQHVEKGWPFFVAIDESLAVRGPRLRKNATVVATVENFMRICAVGIHDPDFSVRISAERNLRSIRRDAARNCHVAKHARLPTLHREFPNAHAVFFGHEKRVGGSRIGVAQKNGYCPETKSYSQTPRSG